MPTTRLLAISLVPFLLVAAVLLFGFPTRTETLFAWTIQPPLTALMLACAYIGGIWFFLGVAREREWHRVAQGFPAVIVFAGLLLTATLLHLGKFHAGTLVFTVWLLLYLTTPFLATATLLLNRRESTTTASGELAIPGWIRACLILIGVGSLITGLSLFVFADSVSAVWPWSLTPLTARVIGAVLTLPGTVNLTMLFERRWSAYRRLYQAQLVSLAFIGIALVIARRDLHWERLATVPFVAGILVSFIVFAAVYLYCERRSAEAHRPAVVSRQPPPKSVQ